MADKTSKWRINGGYNTKMADIIQKTLTQDHTYRP